VQAEEITLTIGQAFDLAYRKFLEAQGKDKDSKQTQQNLQKRVRPEKHCVYLELPNPS